MRRRARTAFGWGDGRTYLKSSISIEAPAVPRAAAAPPTAGIAGSRTGRSVNCGRVGEVTLSSGEAAVPLLESGGTTSRRSAAPESPSQEAQEAQGKARTHS